MKQVKIPKQWTRLRELFDAEHSYERIAEIMASEGLRSQQGKPIDRKWVTTEISRARNEGFIKKEYRGHRGGNAVARKGKYFSFEEIARAILRSDIRPEEQVRLLAEFSGGD